MIQDISAAILPSQQRRKSISLEERISAADNRCMIDNKRGKVDAVHLEESEKLTQLWDERSHLYDLTQMSVGQNYIGGVKQAAVSNWLNGRTALSLKAAVGFAKALRCEVADFSPRLAATLRTYEVAEPEVKWEVGTPRRADDVRIEQWDAAGAMGTGVVLRDQPGVIHGWTVSREWVQKNVPSATSPANLAIVTGFGPSMKPMFNPGDPLLVDTGVKTVELDAVYFFRVGNEGFIKTLQRIPGQGLRVVSANRDSYEAWTVTPDMDFEVFGRVLKVWRSDDF